MMTNMKSQSYRWPLLNWLSIILIIILKQFPKSCEAQITRCTSFVLNKDEEIDNNNDDLYGGWTVPKLGCPNNPEVVDGIPTIENLICTWEAESLSTIFRGAPSRNPPFIYRLCPNTTYNVNGGNFLTVALNNTIFICGNDGHSEDNCIIEGGENNCQVRLSDNPSEVMETTATSSPITRSNQNNNNIFNHNKNNKILEYARFEGITFYGNPNIVTSILALGGPDYTVEFVDCHWIDHPTYVLLQQFTPVRRRYLRWLLQNTTTSTRNVDGDYNVDYDDGEEEQGFMNQIKRLHDKGITQGFDFLQDVTIRNVDRNHHNRILQSITGMEIVFRGGSMVNLTSSNPIFVVNSTVVITGMDFQHGSGTNFTMYVQHSDITLKYIHVTESHNIGFLYQTGGQALIESSIFQSNTAGAEIFGIAMDSSTVVNTCFINGEYSTPVYYASNDTISEEDRQDVASNFVSLDTQVNDRNCTGALQDPTEICLDNEELCDGICMEFISPFCNANQPTPSPTISESSTTTTTAPDSSSSSPGRGEATATNSSSSETQPPTSSSACANNFRFVVAVGFALFLWSMWMLR